jgi:hypothetical protein
MTIELEPKWRFKDYPHIQVTKDKVVFNSKTNRLKKLTLNGSSKGIWITSKKFIIKEEINSHLEKIPKKEYLPF